MSAHFSEEFVSRLQVLLEGCDSLLDLGCCLDFKVQTINGNCHQVCLTSEKQLLDNSKANDFHQEHINSELTRVSEYVSPDSFDYVLALDVDKHIDSSCMADYIRKINDIARKGVIISIQNDGHLYANDEQRERLALPPGTIVDELRGLGFTVYGMDGAKQLLNMGKCSRLLPPGIMRRITDFMSPVIWEHPRQAYRLVAVKDPRDDFSYYYSVPRKEMLEYVPAHANRILDIGCASGRFGKLLIDRRNVEVWGVEQNSEVANVAANRLTKVVQGDINQALLELPRQYFDCVVFNDVLEHLVDPYTVIEELKNIIAPGGVVVASIPNVRHWKVLFGLLFGDEWQYEDNGVLDRTHLRFFTRKSIARMFSEAGYECKLIKGINPSYSMKYLLANLLSFGILSNTRFIQYACVATPI